MKSPATQLQTSYYSLLNGNVSYDSTTVPVYTTVPETPTYPYIHLGQYTETDDSTKSDFGNECTFSLTIVDRFGGNFGSEASIYSIWNDLKQIIRTRPIGLSLTDFSVLTSVVDNSITREEKTETYLYKIMECRFRHLIRQD